MHRGSSCCLGERVQFPFRVSSGATATPSLVSLLRTTAPDPVDELPSVVLAIVLAEPNTHQLQSPVLDGRAHRALPVALFPAFPPIFDEWRSPRTRRHFASHFIAPFCRHGRPLKPRRRLRTDAFASEDSTH